MFIILNQKYSEIAFLKEKVCKISVNRILDSLLATYLPHLFIDKLLRYCWLMDFVIRLFKGIFWEHPNHSYEINFFLSWNLIAIQKTRLVYQELFHIWILHEKLSTIKFRHTFYRHLIKKTVKWSSICFSHQMNKVILNEQLNVFKSFIGIGCLFIRDETNPLLVSDHLDQWSDDWN